MKIKELVKQSYEDLKNLNVTWFNIISLVLIVLILSSITTPIIGVPVGLLGGAYILKRRDDNNKQ